MNEISKMKDQNNKNQGRTIIVNQKEKERISAKINGVGIAGFILAAIGLFFGWIPIFGWFISASGLILSFIGIFKKPRGLAIAGLVISLLGFIWLAFLFKDWLF